MKITGVNCYAIDASYADMPTMPRNYIIVEVETDEGIVGYGDAGNWPVGDSLPGIVAEIGRLIVGEDPRNIEKIWQIMYRGTNYIGIAGLTLTAISGIDMALWDIAGKAANLPVYRLLGGKCRDRIKLYANYWTRGLPFDCELYAKAAAETVAMGYDALKFYVIPPFDGDTFSRSVPLSVLNRMVEMVDRVRQAVGPDIEIYLECGGKLDSHTATRFLSMVSKFNIGFAEEPVPPENIEVMKRVSDKSGIPLASGERICTSYGFRGLLTSQAVDIIQPDISRTGGITEMKKIASFAETYHIPVAPHNANSPLATVASIHFAASTPNFLSLEYFTKDVPWRDRFMSPPVIVKNGYAEIPELPGLGVSIDMDFLLKGAHIIAKS